MFVLTLSGKNVITDPVHVRDVKLPFGDQFMRQRPPIVAPNRARAMYALDKIVKLNYYRPSNGGTVLANYLRMPEIARRRAYLSILADRCVLCVDNNTCRYILPGWFIATTGKELQKLDSIQRAYSYQVIRSDVFGRCVWQKQVLNLVSLLSLLFAWSHKKLNAVYSLLSCLHVCSLRFILIQNYQIELGTGVRRKL